MFLSHVSSRNNLTDFYDFWHLNGGTLRKVWHIDMYLKPHFTKNANNFEILRQIFPQRQKNPSELSTVVLNLQVWSDHINLTFKCYVSTFVKVKATTKQNLAFTEISYRSLKSVKSFLLKNVISKHKLTNTHIDKFGPSESNLRRHNTAFWSRQYSWL